MIRKILNFLFPPLWDGGDVNDRLPQPTKEEFDRQLEEQLRLFQEKKQAKDGNDETGEQVSRKSE